MSDWPQLDMYLKIIKMCVVQQSQRHIPDYRFVFKKGDECISNITTGRAADLLLFTWWLAARPTTTAVFKIDLHLFHVYYFFPSLIIAPLSVPLHLSVLLPLTPTLSLCSTPCCFFPVFPVRQISWFFSVMVPLHLHTSHMYKHKYTCTAKCLISFCVRDCGHILRVCVFLCASEAYITLSGGLCIYRKIRIAY